VLGQQLDLGGYRVLALEGDAGELSNQDLLEGRVGLAALVIHLPELGPVSHAAALGLIHVLAGDVVAVLRGKGAQRPQLVRDGQVRV